MFRFLFTFSFDSALKACDRFWTAPVNYGKPESGQLLPEKVLIAVWMRMGVDLFTLSNENSANVTMVVESGHGYGPYAN